MGMIEAIPPGHIAKVKEQFALAADLGQSNDPTAIAVLHHRHVSHMNVHGQLKFVGETFDIRHLQRLPLGLSYVEQVQHVGQLLARPPLIDGCEFVIDATGVGRAVADLFNAAGMQPDQVSITAGDTQTSPSPRRWHVPKGQLISMLDARLHTGELRFAAELSEAGAMRDELTDFRRKVSVAGRYSYEARVGRHDDLVLAVALALWAIIGKPKPAIAAFGFWSQGINAFGQYSTNAREE